MRLEYIIIRRIEDLFWGTGGFPVPIWPALTLDSNA